MNYAFTYVFQDANKMNKSKVVVSLSTENGTRNCQDKYQDGDVVDTYSSLGKINTLAITPEKHIFLQDIKECRHKPYFETFSENLLQGLQRKCSQPCKSKNYIFLCYALLLNEEIKKMPMCEKEQDEKCFDEVFAMTTDMVVERPCTKLQYKVKNTQNAFSEKNLNLVSFKISFVPPKVTVFEEYLIYDFVTMIGAIGGTMGLCVGFSFFDIMGLLLKLFEKITNRWKKASNVDDSLVMEYRFPTAAVQRTEGTDTTIQAELRSLNLRLTVAEGKIAETLS